MEIRPVQNSDVTKIKEIADSLIVNPNETDKRTGFYDYSLTQEQYERRTESDFFLVGCNGPNLEGFCMAYDSDFVKEISEQEQYLENDTVFNYLQSLNTDYVYVDQFAVKNPRSFIGRKVSTLLFEELNSVSKEKESIIGVIPHSPWKNEYSVGFFSHQGAKLVDEIQNESELVFGVYRIYNKK